MTHFQPVSHALTLSATLLIASCATTSSGGSSGAADTLPAVWAVGPDRLLELDPSARIRPDILPMYGGMERDERLLTAAGDAAFVAAVTKEFGSREAASQRWVEQGIRFYRVDEYEKAMMRFNQAWLLDDTNAGIYHGYAVVYQDHGSYLEAGQFAEQALEIGLADPRYRADCVYMVVAREGALSGQRGGPPSAERIAELQARSESLLAAAATDCTAEDRGYVETLRFKTRMLTGLYDKAWESVAALDALGEPLDPKSVKQLEAVVPRPAPR